MKACGNLGEVDKGQEIHAEVIAGYSEHGYSEKALKCFEQMKLEGISPDSIIFLYGLKACGSIGAVIKGREIHAGIEPFQGNLFLQSSLVDMYVKCGFLEEAKELFDNLPVRDAVLWTTIITGCADHGHGEEALKYFEHMQHNGISPNSVTFVSCLKACSSLRDKDKGEKIHAEVERIGLLGKDLTVGNTLVDMYAKCGVMSKAQEVFDKLQLRDVVSWNVLIAGYVQNKLDDEALLYFQQMYVEGFVPEVVAFISILKARGNRRFLDIGKKINDEVNKLRLLGKVIVLGTTMMEM